VLAAAELFLELVELAVQPAQVDPGAFFSHVLIVAVRGRGGTVTAQGGGGLGLRSVPR
jgi:hypothetical protein